MPRINHSQSRLLLYLQVEFMPLVRQAREFAIQADATLTSPEITAFKHACDQLLQMLDMSPGRRAVRFWNRVDTRGEHMIWTGAGQGTPDGTPILEWDGRRTTAARVAKYLITGRWPDAGIRLKKLCDIPRCIAPTCHQESIAATGRITSLRYDDMGRPCCQRGHVLKREPRKGEKIYCSQCYQLDKLVNLGTDLSAEPVLHMPEDTRFVLTPLRVLEAEARDEDKDRREVRERVERNRMTPQAFDALNRELDEIFQNTPPDTSA